MLPFKRSILFALVTLFALTACVGMGSEPEPTVYAIGDTGAADGIVFYITDGGLHGLEAAPVDQAIPFC